MKKTFMTMAFAMMTIAMLFAQNPKPEYGKTHPTFIKPATEIGAYQKAAVFNSFIEMSANDKMQPVKQYDDHLGFHHEKYQQYYKGIEVAGATYTVHSKDGLVKSMSGQFMTIGDLDVQPSLSGKSALNAAKAHVNASRYAWESGNTLGLTMEEPQGQLVVVADPQAKQAPRLAYKFDIYAAEPLYRAYVFVDAHTGEFIMENLRIHDANVPATGNSSYNGNVSFTADQVSANNYRLRQTASGNGVETYSLNNGTNYNTATDITSSSTNFTSDDVAVQAHYGAEQTHSYYLTQHGRNSYDGNGSVLKSYVHYSTNYVNAFWDGIRMTYGDGDGTSYGPLVSLDICGHELTHGVTENSAALVYQNESGALNESFSDIFGEAVENYATGSNDWRMGEQIGAGGTGGALRNMANPNEFGDPDTYNGTNWYTGSADNGGVHTNSGVQNKWFYILTAGETGTNDLGNSYSVTGLGIANAASVAYRNLTVYLNANSNYAAARAGAIQAAVDLFGAGSAEEIAVTDAWYAVGVGGAYQPPIGCVTNIVDLTIVLDNYPSETTWDLKDAGGATVASGGPYSTNGGTVTQQFNLTAGDYTFTIHDSYGDGICCAYGSGSYTLVSNGVTIVSGGSFASSEATAFCVQGGGGADTTPPSTPGSLTASNTTQTSTDLSWTASSDNVGVTGYNVYVDGVLNGNTTALSYTVSGLTAATTYNMQVTAYDAAGNESTAASVSVTTLSGGGGGGGTQTLSADYFETGWDGWIDGGGDCYRYSGSRSWEGNYSIRIRDNSGTKSSMTSSTYDVSSFNQLDIEFYFYPNSMEYGEDFWVRYYDGSAWNTVAAYASGTSFNNGSFYVATVTISNANYNFPSNAKFRFQCDASSNADQIYIDAVTITGTSGGAVIAGQSGQTIELVFTPTPMPSSYSLVEEEGIAIYPNPASDFITLRSAQEIRSAEVFSMTGALLKSVKTFEGSYEIDVDDLAPGMYIISIETADETVVKKFVRQ
ncbi:MAG TPA: T9SS type A sorting domain-containing protein [Bacteroidetes bacterium]|nr:T9SS type A sorting domain-containing protein [Bacteroidota bacterium]